MWKPETEDKTLPSRLSPKEGQPKEVLYNTQGDIRTQLRKDCEG